MMEDIIVRPARAEEAEAIVALVRSGFDPDLLRFMIYGCDGIERYVAHQINAPAALADTVYLVAVAAERVVGCVELRMTADGIFLNYICTDPAVRGRGLAGRLLGESLGMVPRGPHGVMHLDVFESNRAAGEWYERLGFRRDWTTVWSDIPVGGAGEAVPARVSGYPQAKASQEAYGFSSFGLATPSGTYQVGCLGNDWFRVTQPELLADSAALSALHRFDSRRRILALIREDLMPGRLPAEAREIVRARRMSLDLDTLLGRFAD